MKKTITLLLVLLLLTGCVPDMSTQEEKTQEKLVNELGRYGTKFGPYVPVIDDILINLEIMDETQQVIEQTKKEIEPAKEPPLVDDIIGDI